MKPKRDRTLALVLALLVLATIAVLALAADFAYAMIGTGAWRANHWLDRAHIPRETSLPDPELGFIRKPHLTWRGRLATRDIVYRTDENGFRNAAGIPQADIVFIGDSFTEAAHTPESETFVQLIGTGAGLRVVNLGRGAYGPQQELGVLRRYAFAYRPKLIVWQFFTGNDVSDAEEFAEWVRGGRRHDVPLLTRWIANSLLRKAAMRALDLPSRGAAPATLRYTDGSSEDLRIRYEREPSLTRGGVACVEQTIAEAARLCADRGIDLLVLSIPTMLHALEPYLQFDDPEDRARFCEAGCGNAPARIARQLERACLAQRRCTFIDLFPPLRRAAAQNNRRLYIPDDEHLDARGHAVVARVVLDYLQSNGAMAVDLLAANEKNEPKIKHR